VNAARPPGGRADTPRPSGASAMDVKEVLLPSMGVRYEFTSNHGERIGIVARRGGYFEIVLYGNDDPDQARPVFRLTDEEADAVAQILGAPRIAERFVELTREIPGLEAGHVHILPTSVFVDRPLGDPRGRTRPGASIFGAVRNAEGLAAPGPSATLLAAYGGIVVDAEVCSN